MSHYQPHRGRGGGRYGNHSLGRGYGHQERNSIPNFRGGGGRGRGRGRGRWGGRPSDHRGRGRGGGRSGNRMGRGDLQYRPSAFDPIEEIGDLSCPPCTEGKGSSEIVRIAVEGCCHGELDLIYDRLMDHQKTSGREIDLLICCGDFQSLRNPADFNSSSIPPKYRRLGTFAKYYAGEKVAPILTIFIGGNHEASQPLRELHYGGFVAPNIYFLGSAGVVRYRGIRIAGISGIYKSHDYEMGYHEAPPYDHRTVKSVYHVRKIDVERMKLLSSTCGAPLDGHTTDNNSNNNNNNIEVFVSHDWPLGIEQHGDTRGLIRRKPYFKAEIERNELGSPPNRELLDTLKPKHWFSAHLHVKFQATVVHRKSKPDGSSSNDTDSTATKETPTVQPTSSLLMPSQARSKSTAAATATATGPSSLVSQDENRKTANLNAGSALAPLPFDENNASDTDTGTDKAFALSTTTEFHGVESSESKCPSDPIPDLTDLMTKFLALDKCLPRRQFLSVLNVRLPNASGSSRGEPSLSSTGTTEKQQVSSKKLQENEFDATKPASFTNDSATSHDKNSEASRTRKHHLEYDPEWLAILKQTHHWNTTERRPVSTFSVKTAEDTAKKSEDGSPVRYDSSWVKQRFEETFRDERAKRMEKDDGDGAGSGQTEGKASRTLDSESAEHYLEIPRDFVPTVPYYTDDAFQGNRRMHSSPPVLPAMGNPQTDRLLHILELTHILTRPYDPCLTQEAISAKWRCSGEKQTDRGSHRDIKGKEIVSTGSNQNNVSMVIDDENEIDIDIDIENEDGDGDRRDGKAEHGVADMQEKGTIEAVDDNEIEIDDIDDEGDDNEVGDDSKTRKNSEGVTDDTDDTNEIDLDGDESEIDSKATVFKKARLED